MPDLKQIAAIFNDCIDTIRSQKHPNLEKAAVEWLTDARYQLMRQIEAEYYKLAQSRDNPNAQPSWALDPSADLHLWTTAQPPILKPYETAIAQNLQMLMADCGFNAAVFPLRHSYDINIRFPERIANRPRSVIPQLLQIDDQFSCANGARRFSQRLLGNDQAVSGGEGGDNASRSSSVTLSESSQAGPRRSTRKRNRRGKRTAASRSVSQASTAPGTLAEGSTRRSARIRYASTPTL